ncbi:hypothetical protein IV494_14470 [Kaistella sp. G5-32]|uniref:Lipoprotein n=1 Tax=Kaistella gelatinilytica TaxID=2787636 RepID=A0ABS0FFB9_9FLAO|nr:hypothetical protein [Kaistella gelatinilytica]MBF8458385.1 hypothetical protein [Kaistella gelatinilytica]
MKNQIILFSFLALLSCKTTENKATTLNDPSSLENLQFINPKFQGQYSVKQEIEETTTGTSFITYSFSIEKDNVLLKTNTYHEPIICNGHYKAVEHNNILELYYLGNEGNCKSGTPNFQIKKDENKYFIKGVGGEGTINQWVVLQKK